ncbi:hypothetical protein, partial [Trichloromonas sp.]|uniref:hypothetical protein n=1 Tax=Trichloromonas sp. TaxID=3069249 RepID=UPI003D813990
MRVLFSPLSILHSHVSRCLATAEALIGQGHQAAFVAGVQGRALIEMAGFHCYPGCDPPFAAVVAAGAPRAYRQMFEQLAPEVTPVRFCFGDHLAAELAAIDAFDPDLLVTDNSLAGPLAAQLRGLRRAEIRNLAGLASHREERAGASAESAPDLAKIFYRLLLQATA